MAYAENHQEYLAEEDWVSCCRSFSLWGADWLPYISTILIFPLLISCMKQDLLDHPPFWIYGTSLLSPRHIMFQNHPQRRIKPCMWTIPLTEIALLVLHIAYLLADLIISVMKSAHWGKLDYPYCCKECPLMQTWYWLSIQDSFCIQTRYSKFHCSLLITSFHLSELPSIWIPYWFFRSGVGWRATLIRGK